MILTASTQSALRLARAGDFSAAVEVLGDSWPGLGIEPDTAGSDPDYARLLMLCGYLTLNIGAIEMRPVQMAAKDMLSKAARLFANDPDQQQARLWLGVAYLRSGESRESLALMDTLLAERSTDIDVTFNATLVKVCAYFALDEWSTAADALESIESLVEVVPPLTQGKFYLNCGMVCRQQSDHVRALAHYNRAVACFAEAGSLRYEAAAENNRARVYTLQGRLDDALQAALHALTLFQQIRDRAHEAKAWDELARVHEAKHDYLSMEDAASRAVSLLSTGDHAEWLAEALVTHGRASILVGRSRFVEALAVVDRYGSGADTVIRAMWDTVGAAKTTERMVYERLLCKHNGRISPVAHEIGWGHQMLQKRLENHFPELLPQRRPKWRRHKPLMTK